MFSIFKKPAIGLDISDNSIEAVQLKRVAGKISVGAYSRTKLSSGIVEDGKIKKPDRLATAIKKLLDSPGSEKFTTHKVISSLPESRLLIHVFELPVALKGQELDLKVEEEASKLIPARQEDLYWDFKIVSSDKDLQEILFIAAPVNIVNSYTKVMEQSGLKLMALDFESAAMTRSLLKGVSNSTAVMLVDIGARTTIISIFDKGAIHSTVNIKIGGDKLTKTIAKKFGISEQKAEEKKRNCGMDETKEGGKCMLVLQSVLQLVIKEIKKSIDYYQQHSGRTITAVILSGGTSRMPKIDSYFSSNLDLPVEVGQPWVGVSSAKKVPPIFLATAIGLALRGVKKKLDRQGINLLPTQSKAGPNIDEEKKELRAETKKLKKVNLRLVGLVILLFVAIGVLVGIFTWQKQRPPTPPPKFDIISINIPRRTAITTEEEIIDQILDSVSDETAEETAEETADETAEETAGEPSMVTVIETGIGYLNVRSGPGTSYNKIAIILVGESYELLEEDGEWYKLKISDDSSGWVFGEYIEK